MLFAMLRQRLLLQLRDQRSKKKIKPASARATTTFPAGIATGARKAPGDAVIARSLRIEYTCF